MYNQLVTATIYYIILYYVIVWLPPLFTSILSPRCWSVNCCSSTSPVPFQLQFILPEHMTVRMSRIFPRVRVRTSSATANCYQRVSHSHHKYTPADYRSRARLASEKWPRIYSNDTGLLVQRPKCYRSHRKKSRRKMKHAFHFERVYQKNMLFRNWV